MSLSVGVPVGASGGVSGQWRVSLDKDQRIRIRECEVGLCRVLRWDCKVRLRGRVMWLDYEIMTGDYDVGLGDWDIGL